MKREALRHYKSRRYKQAFKIYQKVLALQSNVEIDILDHLGTLAKGLKRCDRAILYYQGFLRIESTGSVAKEVKRELAECYKAVGKTGTLKVTSNPSEADIRIDHVPFGFAPVRGVKLVVGTYHIRARSVDHKLHRGTIKVVEGKVTVYRARLRKQIFFGKLVVKVTPTHEGVTVFLDKVNVGKAPYTRKKLPARRYLVHLEKPGWDRWVRYITIVRGETTTVSANMEATGTHVPIPRLP